MLLDALLIAIITGLLAALHHEHQKVRELRRSLRKASRRFLDLLDAACVPGRLAKEGST